MQKPEDIGARLCCALVANVLIGIGGSALVIRCLSSSGQILTRRAGFRGLQHAVVALVIGGALGYALYDLQGAPTFNPVVHLNAYAKVLVGSIAEIRRRGDATERAREMSFGDPCGVHRQRPLRCLPLRP